MANRCARPPSRAAPCAPRRESVSLDVTASPSFCHTLPPGPFAGGPPRFLSLAPFAASCSSVRRSRANASRETTALPRLSHGKRNVVPQARAHVPLRPPLTKADEALPSRPTGYALRTSPRIRQPGRDSIPVLLSHPFVTLTPQRPYTMFTLLIAPFAAPCSDIRRSQADVSCETFAFPAAFPPTMRHRPVRPSARAFLRRQHPSATEARFSGIRSS